VSLHEQLEEGETTGSDWSDSGLGDIRGIHFTIHVDELRYPCAEARSVTIKRPPSARAASPLWLRMTV